MTAESQQLAYVGLGAMGIEIAQLIQCYLIETGNKPLIVHNRTLARAQALKERVPDIQIAESLADLAQADVIFTCLLNDAAVERTIDGLLSAGLKKGAIIVEQSTIAPGVTKSLAERVEAYGAHFVAIPILGPPAAARAGKLKLLAAGSPTIVEKVLPFLTPSAGDKVIRAGDQPHLSMQLKLVGNFFVTAFVESLSEGMTLGEASGVGQDKVKEVIDALFPGTLLTVYSDRIINNTFMDQIHFPLTSARKDATHIVNLAKEHNAKVPITELFLNQLNKVLEKHGDYDMTGISIASREHAGLKADGSRP
ncbi:NAD binding domain of 6-phosphogluconate dehydrogenase-domain-containing protein [Fennellomyces sp. T-0311]|nr:NAD binding domain of 6-phosphogluconate dehydrogenase-domain-containing protein [Fennellomyces sp. T-0311]